jgi:RNA polymerase sigma-70 factor (ECF subfamily)
MALEDDEDSRSLVERIQQGIDPEGNFERLFRRHYDSLRRFFVHRRFSPEDASDLTQDVFFRVYKSIGTWRGDARFESWLFEIAANVWHNELRRRGTVKRKARETSLDELDEQGKPRSESIESGADNALDEALERERSQGLAAEIQKLPPQMRQVFLLRYQQDRKYKEIALLLGISIETVKAHLFQARKRLRLALEDPGEETEG